MSMDLLFCCLCHESVPNAEVSSGNAISVSSRVLCEECCDLVSSLGDGPPRNSAGARFAPWGVFFLVLFAAFAAGLAWLESHRLHAEAAQDLVALQTRIQRVQENATSQGFELEESFLSARSLLEAQVETARDEASHLGQLGRQLEGQLGSIASEVSLLASSGENRDSRLGRLEGGLAVFEDRARDQKAAHEMLRERISAMDSRIEQAGPAVDKEAVTLEDEFPPKIAVLLRQLQAEDPSTRYDALENLVAFPDERILSHLYPMLADPYEFSRFLTAHTLGDWGSKPAVPHLIESLLDEVPWVREASVAALRKITGQNHDFDHAANEEARLQSYEGWKLWWAASGTGFLRGL